MSSDIHIEEFYSDVAKILLQLYNVFPRTSTIYVEDIAGKDTPDEFGLHSERHIACLSAIIWLQQHGYLHFSDTIRQEAVDQAYLTQKAFMVLSSRSQIDYLNETNSLEGMSDYAIQNSITNIQQLRTALKTGSGAKIALIILHILENS